MPVLSGSASGSLSPPVAHAGFVGPYPVAQTVTTEPLAAGFEGPLSVQSWFIATACADWPTCSRKIPGLPNVTGAEIGPNCWSLYVTVTLAVDLPARATGAAALICRDCAYSTGTGSPSKKTCTPVRVTDA